MLVFSYALSFILLLSSVSALVWNPHIKSPTSASRWRAGEKYTVKWNTKVDGQEIPAGVKGTIKLGYLLEGSSDEHLMHDLASGFDLNKGFQSVKLPPNLETRRSYIIVLMGDSGNASPKFTINAKRE